jgi:uncharacterized membrane protein (UPF0127 family)
MRREDSQPVGVYVLVNDRTGEQLASELELAANPLRRMVGLLGRRSLPEGGAMRFQPAGSIHTLFMRFPIDVLFLDADECVVKRVHNLKPWRFAAARGAKYVVELPSGTLLRHDIEVGDLIWVDRQRNTWAVKV